MKIVACIKQVPDTTDVSIDPETRTLVREGVESITNPFDEYAVEEALLTKEKYGGEVHVITMGPPQAIEVLKNALAVGQTMPISFRILPLRGPIRGQRPIP